MTPQRKYLPLITNFSTNIPTTVSHLQPCKSPVGPDGNGAHVPAMPSYFYHLKFELYATPDPTAPATEGAAIDTRHDIWVPSPGSSIFDDLPSHPRSQQSAPQRWQGGFGGDDDYLARKYAAANSKIIDCGAQRGKTHDVTGANDDNRNIVRLSEWQYRARAERSPPPKATNGIGPHTAVRDWRFGRISIESFDVKKEEEGPRRGGAGRMTGKEEATPAASLGPNLGGVGQATKARYVPLETKNTEAGWGIVHLYREADESSALQAIPEASGGKDRGSGDEEGTILCIPAVPSYMSPSDFLGFIGEKWRSDIRHYRMVMTSRMSRYMVLMKFRDRKSAREWRKEFDGKPFDSVEVGFMCASPDDGKKCIHC